MNITELKNYTARAKELESAIYTQEKLKNEHEKILTEGRPSPPSPKEIPPPRKPRYAGYKNNDSDGYKLLWLGTAWALIILSFFSFFYGIVLAVSGEGYSVIFICLVAISIGTGLIHIYYKDESNKKKEAELIHKEELKAYEKNMQIHTLEVNKETRRYNVEMQKYKETLSMYNATSAKEMQKNEDMLSLLKKSLEKHYAEDVIFPKYRNFVAISSIYEYLMSGRCDSLEGANGAYNLYEMELRQNIVIGQLSAVIDNLDQIRNDQYSLYQELCKSNELVTSIAYDLRELNDNSRLTAYYSYVSALASVSPTYTFGIVY